MRAVGAGAPSLTCEGLRGLPQHARRARTSTSADVRLAAPASTLHLLLVWVLFFLILKYEVSLWSSASPVDPFLEAWLF